jgi:mannose/fructose/N-acetylgalactosamine-specific phosphotransferase system component IIC
MEAFDLPIAIMMTVTGILFFWYQPYQSKSIRQKIKTKEISEIEGEKNIRFFRLASRIIPALGICLLIAALLPEN